MNSGDLLNRVIWVELCLLVASLGVLLVAGSGNEADTWSGLEVWAARAMVVALVALVLTFLWLAVPLYRHREPRKRGGAGQ